MRKGSRGNSYRNHPGLSSSYAHRNNGGFTGVTSTPIFENQDSKKKRTETDKENVDLLIERYHKNIRFIESTLNKSKVGVNKIEALKSKLVGWEAGIGNLERQIQIQQLELAAVTMENRRIGAELVKNALVHDS